MIYLKNLFFILVFTFFLFFEMLLNTFFSLDYLILLPFFIALFYISTRTFSNFFISVLMFCGVYYDLLYSSNILGFSSAKFLIVAMLMNFVIANQQKNVFLDFMTFLTGLFIYKFSFNIEFLDAQNLLQLFISSPFNYFLFRILNITIDKNVLKQKI